jgi:hypothetical protein
MSMYVLCAVVAIAVAMFWSERAMGAEPKAEISNLVVEAETIWARVSWRIALPSYVEARVWIFYGEEDAGESVIEWAHTNYIGRIAPGPSGARIGSLLPATRYCVRMLVETCGGQTWSEPVWVRTGELQRIEKKQVGTVVVIK